MCCQVQDIGVAKTVNDAIIVEGNKAAILASKPNSKIDERVLETLAHEVSANEEIHAYYQVFVTFDTQRQREASKTWVMLLTGERIIFASNARFGPQEVESLRFPRILGLEVGGRWSKHLLVELQDRKMKLDFFDIASFLEDLEKVKSGDWLSAQLLSHLSIPQLDSLDKRSSSETYGEPSRNASSGRPNSALSPGNHSMSWRDEVIQGITVDGIKEAILALKPDSKIEERVLEPLAWVLTARESILAHSQVRVTFDVERQTEDSRTWTMLLTQKRLFLAHKGRFGTEQIEILPLSKILRIRPGGLIFKHILIELHGRTIKIEQGGGWSSDIFDATDFGHILGKVRFGEAPTVPSLGYFSRAGSARPIQHVSRERIPSDVQRFVWERDQGQCVKCGCQQDLQFDHVIPVSRGGNNSANNVQILCRACNLAKSNKIGG